MQRVLKLTFIATLLFYSCTTLKLEQNIKVNEEEDWLFAGGDPQKTNISKSSYSLIPPFKLLWDADVDGGLSTNCLSASDGILFINTLNGEFFTVDIPTGKGLGRISSLGKAAYSAPVIFHNNIILTASGTDESTVMSYNMVKGNFSWERDIYWVESSPVMVGETLLVTNKEGKIYKLNIRDGSIFWIFNPVKESGGKLFTSPSYSAGKVFAGNSAGNLYAVNFEDGTQTWKFETGGPVQSDASVYESRIYFSSDDMNFYCLDTAGNMIWKKDIKTRSLSSPTFAGDLVITAGVDGSIIAMNRLSGEEMWRTYTKGTITASPVIHKDKLFIGSYDQNFYCLDAITGSVLWKYKCEGRVKTTAVIWKDYIFTASDDKYVYCFTNENKIQNK